MIFTEAGCQFADEKSLHDHREDAYIGEDETRIACGQVELCQRIEGEDGLEDRECQTEEEAGDQQ